MQLRLVFTNYNIIIINFKPRVILHRGVCTAAAGESNVAAYIQLRRWSDWHRCVLRAVWKTKELFSCQRTQRKCIILRFVVQTSIHLMLRWRINFYCHTLFISVSISSPELTFNVNIFDPWGRPAVTFEGTSVISRVWGGNVSPIKWRSFMDGLSVLKPDESRWDGAAITALSTGHVHRVPFLCRSIRVCHRRFQIYRSKMLLYLQTQQIQLQKIHSFMIS